MRGERELCRLCAPSFVGEPPTALVVAAHPDDEALGAGDRIAHIARGCFVLFVTDGAPTDARFVPPAARGLTGPEYARVRRAEAVRALGIAGVSADRVDSLGVIDLQAAFHLAETAERLCGVLLDRSPEFVVSHAYEGGHPDHDASAFIAHAAVALVGGLGRTPPTLVEMTGYHDRGGRTVRGAFLPAAGSKEIVVALGEEEQRRKRAILSAYATQRDVVVEFGVAVERFRLAPSYDFTCPPQADPLHYERTGFPMSALAFSALARAAALKLGLRGDRL